MKKKIALTIVGLALLSVGIPFLNCSQKNWETDGAYMKKMDQQEIQAARADFFNNNSDSE